MLKVRSKLALLGATLMLTGLGAAVDTAPAAAAAGADRSCTVQLDGSPHVSNALQINQLFYIVCTEPVSAIGATVEMWLTYPDIDIMWGSGGYNGRDSQVFGQYIFQSRQVSREMCRRGPWVSMYWSISVRYYDGTGGTSIDAAGIGELGYDTLTC